MKKIIFLLAAFMPLVSCQKMQENVAGMEPDGNVAKGVISVSLTDGEVLKSGATTAYVDELSYEKNVNNVQLFIFDSKSGVILKQIRFTENYTAMNVDVVPGDYYVFALVNAGTVTDIGNKSLLSDYGFDSIGLGTNSISGSNFVMGGSNTCTVKAAVTSECKISVSRYVSRIALSSIKFNMPEGYEIVKVNCAYLGNVPGKVNLDGSEPKCKFDFTEQPLWYNMGGRNHSTEFVDNDEGLEYKTSDRKIINGKSVAEQAELTCYEPEEGEWEEISSGQTLTCSDNGHPVLMYSFPNSSTQDPVVSKYWTAQKTTLVLNCNISAPSASPKDYYYVIPFDKLEKNKTYTVSLTIESLGSDDPNVVVKKGAVKAVLQVSGWTSGGVIETTI